MSDSRMLSKYCLKICKQFFNDMVSQEQITTGMTDGHVHVCGRLQCDLEGQRDDC